MADGMSATPEERLRALEDRLEIYNIIASHPPSADTGNDGYYRETFATDATVDLGGGKAAQGNEAIAAIVKTPEHQGAIAGGIAHFCGLPSVKIDADRAVAISYLQIITPDRNGSPVSVSGHGTSKGFRIHRVGANHWEFARTEKGWKVTRRTLRPLDGSAETLELLRKATTV